MLFMNTSAAKVIQIPVRKIIANPNQPRVFFSESELSSLAKSIQQNGILQPLSVRKLSFDTYELIAGERRLRASILAGLQTVPCIIVNADDKQAAVFCVLENLQRQDLTFFEEAQGIASLIDIYHLTQQQVAEKLGKKQSTVANKLRLLKLSQEERKLICDHHLSERHARALLAIENVGERKRLLYEVIEKELNVAQTEKLVEGRMEGVRPKRRKPIVVVKDVRLFFNTVSHALQTMRQSGIQAEEEKRETEEYIEYVVRIPKPSSHRRTA